ncbi:MAG: Ribosomal protein L6P [Candidatus Methanohalarchaeum thermophilum]|uniref:50S ribosomal protein L6 n=1 Tax=Methanohalarchaeum thermophilum TaxID=1903181 RepID=A0A1Q6DX65_METT1|nr:MAG: Ribosomal protein L6P [Candidatus Methanohalarchaeum thermophilum]
MARKEVKLPEDVEAEIEDDEVTIKRGDREVSRELTSPKIEIKKKDKKITLKSKTDRKKDKALLGTFTSHIKNMVKGVQKDYVYKIKVLYSHFPIKVETNENHLIIRNFLGENNPRKVEVIGEQTELEVSEEEVKIRGPDKEAVSQTAAKIQQETNIKGKDPRIFQDGMYIVEEE